MNSNKIIYLLLGVIILFSAVIRLYNISNIPSGFQVDEASFGYNAYSLLKTGKDEFGTLLPTSLRSFDDYKAGLLSYYMVPFIAIFGLNEFSVRLSSAVTGLLIIALSFFLTLKLTKRKDLSLLVATLTSICPIFIFLSRIESDSMLSVFLVLLGVYLFLDWIKKKSYVFLAGSLIAWILSLIAYQSPRIFLPLFLPILFLVFLKELSKKQRLISIVTYFIFVLICGYFIISGGARATQTSVLTTPDVNLLLEESIREEGTSSPVVVTRLIHNKPIYYSRALVQNYFSYLDFDFLFFQAEYPVREKIKDFGFLYLIDLPFLILGIASILMKRVRWGYLAIGWILITPLALAPFIQESPNQHRFLLALFPLQLVIGYGILEFLRIIKKFKILYLLSIFTIAFIYSVSLIYYLHQLFVHQPVYRPWYRNYPYKNLMLELKQIEPKYRKIVVTSFESNSYIYYLFFNKIDPKLYQASGSHGNERPGVFGKYEFVYNSCPLGPKENKTASKGEEGVLYVNWGTCVTPVYDIKYIKTLYWADKTPAFKLIEYDPGGVNLTEK